MVTARSYSRNSGVIVEEIDTGVLTELLLGELLDAPLVIGVRVGVQQADRERLDAGIGQLADRPACCILVELLEHSSLGVDPLSDLANVRELDERLWLDVVEESEEWTRRPRLGEVKEVRPALGDEQANARSFSFEHRIRRNGGAVQNRVERLRRDAGPVVDLPCALEHANRLVSRCRRRLGEPERTGPVVVQEEVGERAAHIYPTRKATVGVL